MRQQIVLILPATAMYVSSYLAAAMYATATSSYCYVCVLILAATAMYVSSYLATAMYVSSYLATALILQNEQRASMLTYADVC
jgi:hypothetical protein